MDIYTPLEIREIFHLEFLRLFGRKIKKGSYAVKGGANLRFFFKSFRYSEDMDLDAGGIRKDVLADAVGRCLASEALRATLRSYGIDRIVPPDMKAAKQTETTQRFKVHLMTAGGEDLFTSIEFSRRGMEGATATEPVSGEIVRAYKMAPLIVPHYGIEAAVAQKIAALGSRPAVQARDIFDLYILSSQCSPDRAEVRRADPAAVARASARIYDCEFERFRDTVAAYLSDDDRRSYDDGKVWDEIRLNVASFLSGGEHRHGR
jgi:predicted nucleotidyltransferase component of viral defense system